VAFLGASLAFACQLKSRAATDKEPPPRETLPVNDAEVRIAPASESRARRDAVLPGGPSEDARAVLGPIDVPLEPRSESEDVDYLPSEAMEWVVHVALQGDPELDPKKVAALFDVEWRKRYGGLIIYGLDPATKHWTFLIAADGPKTVTRLQLAWEYAPSWEEHRTPSPKAADYSRRVLAVRTAVASLGTATVTSSATPEDAERRAAHLRDLRKRLDRSVTLVLVAPEGKSFTGQQVWDVMLSLGLQWGDMDCFHWVNEKGVGDASFFTVSTTTSPGYFLPEEVVADRVRVDDLVFGFSVPRAHDPLAVLEAMNRAVEYAKKRLGGTVTDLEGKPVDLAAIRAEIRAVSKELVAAGLPPGSSGRALQLF
jgi:cell division protein ZipA